MIIKGLQKLTLLDYPEHTACTVFTGGCNLRCPFCHNASLALNPASVDEIDEEKFFSFLRKRKGILDGVCITGGEPLINTDIENFILRIKQLGFKVKIDTNGTLPVRLKSVVENGLADYVAVDIKNSKKLYEITVGVSYFNTSPVEKTVDYLMNGNIPYEFRTTVTRTFHTENSMRELSEWIKGAKRYFLQNFVNSGDLINPQIEGYSPEEMQKMLDIVKPNIPSAQIRGI